MGTMTRPENTSIQDPAIKRLSRERIFPIFYLFFALCYIALTISIMVTFQTRSVTFALLGLLLLAGSISSCVMQISKERFWKRIAQRRALALHDAQSFIAASQPWPIESAQLPLTIRVKTNFKLLLYGALILLAVVTIFVVLLSLNTLKLESILIVLSSILLPCALLIILFPLIYGRIYFQSIEVTEEGVTTHYLGETQHIRWEDARLFARYDAINTQGRNPIFQTYELTDDQTVVRWNNVANNLPLMRIESNQGQQEAHKLFRLVTGIVKARTQLPLLDFNDKQPLRDPSPLIGINDPQEVTFSSLSKALWSFVFLGIMGLFFLATGIYQFSFTRPSETFSLTLILIGAFLLLCSLLLLIVIPRARHYYQRLRRARARAFEQQEQFAAEEQPIAVQELPQPETIVQRTSFRATLVSMLITALVLWLPLSFILYPKKPLIGAAFSVLFLGIFLSITTWLIKRKQVVQDIEVSEQGIRVHFQAKTNELRWNEARLFSVYRSPALSFSRKKRLYYELASKETVVRWQKTFSHFWAPDLDPKMSLDDYHRWQDQLNGFIVARTKLPLVDLDKAIIKQAKK